MFDGERYHYAHLNTRRSEPPVATDDDNFIRPPAPCTIPGGDGAGRCASVCTGSTRARSPSRWWQERGGLRLLPLVAMFPVLDHAGEAGDGQACASFRATRASPHPGRDAQPFIYGLCAMPPAAGALFEREAGGLRWIDPR